MLHNHRQNIGFPSYDEAMANSDDFGGIPRAWLTGFDEDEYRTAMTIVHRWFTEGQGTRTGAALLRRLDDVCGRRANQPVTKDGPVPYDDRWAKQKMPGNGRDMGRIRWAPHFPIWVLPVAPGKDTVTSDGYATLEGVGWRLWVLVETDSIQSGKLEWEPARVLGGAWRPRQQRAKVPPWLIVYHELGHCLQGITNLRRYHAMYEAGQDGTGEGVATFRDGAKHEEVVNHYLLDFENLALHEYPMCDEVGTPRRELYEEMTADGRPIKFTGLKSAVMTERQELMQGFNDERFWGEIPKPLAL